MRMVVSMNKTESTDATPVEYFIATLLGIVFGVCSLGGALLLNVGPEPLLGQATGAAWAWAIGAATIMWVLPWLKKAVA